MTVAEHPTPADYAADFHKHIMAARSKPSSRRSTLRGSRDHDHVSSVTDKPQQNGVLPTLRSKRPRLTTTSDQEQLSKKIKVDKVAKPPTQLRIPLRTRHADPTAPASPPRSVDTDHVLNTSRKLPLLKSKPIDFPSSGVSTEASTPKNEYDALIREEKRAKKAALAPQDTEKRTLRSHDGGSRSKSELAQYFPNYERMISLDPSEPELITPKTNITFIDDLQASAPNSSPKSASKILKTKPRRSFSSIPLHHAKRIDLSTLAQPPRKSLKDPLHPDVYIKAHRRPERQEKQLRNIEKERAQHEKVQLDRLLGELKGPDWLKVMGISGITESEKKLYEPKRLYFVREVSSLIDKFKHWKEEEKRRKLERDQALLEQMEDDSSSNSSSSNNDDDDDEEEEEEEEQEEKEQGDDDEADESSQEGESGAEDEIADSQEEDEGIVEDQVLHSSPTNSSDVDAQAAQQLLQEASSANLPSPRNPRPRKTSGSRSSKSKVQPPPEEANRTKMSTKPIHSFFSKSPPRPESEKEPVPVPQLQKDPIPESSRRRGARATTSAKTIAPTPKIPAPILAPAPVAPAPIPVPTTAVPSKEGKAARRSTRAKKSGNEGEKK